MPESWRVIAECDSIFGMTRIQARIHIGPDRRISGTAPAGVPEGEHEATIVLPEPEPQAALQPAFRLEDLPLHHLGWDADVSLRRADLYGDDER